VVAPQQTEVRPGVGTRTGDDTQTGEPEVAHIVKAEEGGDIAARVMEARIYGTPIEALCGAVFVPHRDPTRLPICAACKDIYDTERVLDGDLPETPGA
jgi:hypothetical protein